jgi:hypothetical protein
MRYLKTRWLKVDSIFSISSTLLVSVPSTTEWNRDSNRLRSMSTMFESRPPADVPERLALTVAMLGVDFEFELEFGFEICLVVAAVGLLF